jgi:PAS domain S-box-containing protein
VSVLIAGTTPGLEQARALLRADQLAVTDAPTPAAVLGELARGPTPEFVVIGAAGTSECEALLAAVRGHVRGEDALVLAIVPPEAVGPALLAGARLALPATVDGEFLRAAIAALRQAQAQAKRATVAREPGHEVYFVRNPHPMWFFDVDSLAFVAVNDAAVAKYGYSRAEFLAMTIKDIRPPEDVARLLEVTRQVERGLTATKGWRHRAKDGRTFEVEIISYPVTYAGRSCELILAHDITDWVDAQARVEALHGKLLVADRMAAIGTLAAGVAHEINNPLTWIRTNLAYVLEGIQKIGGVAAHEQQQALREAIEGVSRVRTIVGDLKSFTRADEDSVGSVDVARAVAAAVRLAVNEVAHRARVHIDVAPGLSARGNEARLIQVLLNLVVNAAHALPEGRVSQNEIRIAAAGVGDEVQIEVADSGPGVDPAIVDRIFDPFFSTKPLGQGSGLGLWVSRRIIESLGGQLVLVPTGRVGATLRVTLPLATSRPLAAPVVAAPARPMQRRARVLIVDDEPLVGRALARCLQEDADVEVETGALPALQRFQRGERFDMVVSDVMMPDLAGAEFHAALYRIDPALAREVVFMTGGAFSGGAQAFLDSVPNLRLDKPIELRRLRELVRAAIRGPDDGK